MINLSQGPPPPPPIPVEVDPVTFVGGNTTSLADGLNKEIDGVGFPGIFTPGDIVTIHNTDGTNFTGIIDQVGQASITLDAALDLTVKPGAVIIKVGLSAAPLQWVCKGYAIGLISPGGQTNFTLAPGTRFIKVVPNKVQTPTNVLVTGQFPGSITTITYFNGVLTYPGGSVVRIDPEAISAGLQILLTVTGAGTLCLVYALEPTPVTVFADKNSPLAVSSTIASSSLPIPNSERLRSYDWENFNQPAAGARADMILAAVVGLRYIVHSSMGRVVSAVSAADGAGFSVNPGSTIVVQHITGTEAVVGSTDSVPLPNTALPGNINQALEIAFRTAPQNAGNFQSVHGGGWLIAGEPTAE